MADKADPTISGDVPKTVSRRNFIKGVITSGVAVSSAGYLFRASTLLHGQQSDAGVRERLITVNVNGQQRRVDVMKQETLAWTLRYKLGLTGTKLGCDRAECGSCTVLLDDIPHYSCSVLTHTVRGRKIVTIEGLASADGTLHPVQQGVIDEQGFQCAFCVPGFIMTVLENQSQSYPPAVGAGPLRMPVPLPGLRQDSYLTDARRREHAEGEAWITKAILIRMLKLPGLPTASTGPAAS
ncbi:MAG: 2Fe-2S iron-sulfur cluster-binding protein [Candidatus Sulfotelmatobacter sp.]